MMTKSGSRRRNVRPAAVRRNGGSRGVSPPTLALRPGYFLEPVLAWFGPDWKPATNWGHDETLTSERARAARAVRVARGDTGSIHGLSHRSDAQLAALQVPGAVAALLRRVAARAAR